MASRSPTVAVPFVVYNDSAKKYEVTEQSVKILEGLPDKIGVVVVAGRYRSGKSFLMNQLVRANVAGGEGFGVGHTIESYTKGIWMWPVPIRAKTKTGEAIDVIVMDSEGLGATEATEHRDSEIFSLSTLLCSVLIFNGTRTIDENSIQTLGFIANLTKHIRVKAGAAAGEEDTVEDYNKFLPSFVWILRDFSLDLVDDDGNRITSDDYMEHALMEQPGYDKETQSRNRIRKCVTSFFTDRTCVTLVRPVANETQLQSLDTLPEDTLRREFRDQMNALRSMLFESARAKTLNGRTINGPMLIALAHSYVAAINAGGVPNVGDAWESAAASQCQKLYLDSVKVYHGKMDPGVDGNAIGAFPCEEASLRDTHSKVLGTLLTTYDRLAPGAPTVTPRFRDRIEKECNERFVELLEENSKESRKLSANLCRDLRKKHVLPALRSLQAFLASLPQNELEALAAITCADAMTKLWEQWRALREEYLSKPTGPSGITTLATSGLDSFQDDCLDACKQVDACLSTALANLRSWNARHQESATHLQSQLSSRQSELASTAQALSAAVSEATDAKQQLSFANTELSALRASLVAAKSEVDDSKAYAAQLSAQLAERQAALARKSEELAALRRELEASERESQGLHAHEKALQQLVDTLQRSSDSQRVELEEERSKALQLASQLASAVASSTGLDKQLQTTVLALQDAQAALEQERAELKHMRDSLKLSQSEASVAKAQLDAAQAELDGNKRTIERLRSEVQDARSLSLQSVADNNSLTAQLKAAQAQLQSSEAGCAGLKTSVAAQAEEIATLRGEIRTLQQDCASKQAEANAAQSQAAALARDVDRLQRIVQESKDTIDTYAKRCGEAERDVDVERRKAYELESNLQAALRFESRFEAERERTKELQARISELAAGEATWRSERSQFADVTNKLEAIRAELSREREENVDMRRKLSALKDTEFELRAERERRQSLEAKLATAEKDSDAAAELQSSVTRLRLEKQAMSEDLDALKHELHKTRSVVLDFKEQLSQSEIDAKSAALEYERRIHGLDIELSETKAALEKESTKRVTSELVLTELKKQIAALKFDAYKVDELKASLDREREMLNLKQQALQRSEAALADAQPPKHATVDEREHKLLQRECEATRLQVEEMWLANVKLATEIDMLKRELEQARLQRKALRTSVQRWTDEAAHEKACRVAAETLLRAAAGYSDAMDVSQPHQSVASTVSLTASQQQQLRALLDSV